MYSEIAQVQKQVNLITILIAPVHKMNKNNYLIFGIVLLGSLILTSSYTAPVYGTQLNVTLCNDYIAPVYGTQLNVTLGDTDSCGVATCWGVSGTRQIYVPANCTYYVTGATLGYAG